MIKEKYLKYMTATVLLAMLAIYFFGCSPLKDMCYAYGIRGRAFFICGMFTFSVGELYILCRCTALKNYFSKEKRDHFWREFRIERKEFIGLAVLILFGGGDTHSWNQLGHR